jgi:hypothetical protein
MGSSGTGVNLRSTASEPFGTTFSSIERDEGLDGTAIDLSGTAIGSS